MKIIQLFKLKTCFFFYFTKPVSISYIKVPKDHQSTAFVYPLPSRTSGAKYSGVPQKVAVRESSARSPSFEIPKSVKQM